MRKLLVICLLIGMFYACERVASRSMRAVIRAERASERGEKQSSKTSPSYIGVYKGIMFDRDGKDIEATCTIGAHTYKKEVKYTTGEDTKILSTGVYTWNDSSKIITLLLSDHTKQTDKYMVEDDRLIPLDAEGNRIAGDMADKYILHKEDI